MHRSTSRLSVGVLLLAACAAACSDVGDDLAGGGDPAHDAAPGRADGGADATVDARPFDATVPDADPHDAGSPDMGISDSNEADTTVLDTGALDTGAQDASDAGQDATLSDSGPVDANVADTATSDTGPADTGPADTGPADTGPADTGAHDSGTVSACAQFNGGAACTATEQRFVDKSVDCYQCMVNAGCLDDTLYGDSDHECADVSGNATAGAKAGTPRATLCLDTLDCILSPAKLCAADDVNLCYCGSLGAGNGCLTATSGANGSCLQVEVDGLEHLAADPPSTVLPDYTGLTRGAGMANQLFVCAKSNGCDVLCAK